MFRFMAVFLSVWAATAQETAPLLQRASELENEGDLRFQQLKWKEAEGLLEKALDIKKSGPGEQHVTTAALVEKLGQLYMIEGKFDAAESLLRDTAQMQRANPGRTELSTAIGSLGNLYLSQRRFALAKSTLDEALQRTSTLNGADRAHINSLLCLASYYRIMTEFTRAEPHAL